MLLVDKGVCLSLSWLPLFNSCCEAVYVLCETYQLLGVFWMITMYFFLSSVFHHIHYFCVHNLKTLKSAVNGE